MSVLPGFRVRKPNAWIYAADKRFTPLAKEIKDWVSTNFGPSGTTHWPPHHGWEDYLWYTTIGNIYFKNEQDAVFFVLRWK